MISASPKDSMRFRSSAAVSVVVGKLDRFHQIRPDTPEQIEKRGVISQRRKGQNPLSFHIPVVDHGPSLQVVEMERAVPDAKKGHAGRKCLHSISRFPLVDQYYIGFLHHFKRFPQETERKKVHGRFLFVTVHDEQLNVLSHVSHLVAVVEDGDIYTKIVECLSVCPPFCSFRRLPGALSSSPASWPRLLRSLRYPCYGPQRKCPFFFCRSHA